MHQVSTLVNMLPVLLAALRTYAPYVTFPVALVIGFVGYQLEGMISDKSTPEKRKSTEEERIERQLLEALSKDATQVESIKEKKFIRNSVLNKNLSPSLSDNW